MTNHQSQRVHALNGQDGPKQSQVVVVMVPLPAQGHLNQLLELSRLIQSYSIPVHLVGTTTHNTQAKLRVNGWDVRAITNIHFHDFEIPPFASPTPNPNAKNKFPAHLIPAFKHASSHLREPVSVLLRSLSSKARKVIVIHDSLMASVIQEVQLISNAESYNFHSVSAFTMCLYQRERMGRHNIHENGVIPEEIPTLEGCFTDEFSDFIDSQYQFHKLDSGRVYNTCRLIEGAFMDLVEKEQIETTEGTMNNEQIEQLAIGLKQSGQKFIWVLRDADKGDVFKGENERKAELPIGYENSVDGVGLVARDWVPQLEILSHPATGGFMSHCGWNSCMESITMGVPIAAWPMHSDQPRNAVLITELLKIGVTVKEWARRDEIVTAKMVESSVKRLMASDEGDGMKKRAAELGESVRRSMAEGGASRMEIDSFIAHISSY
ncbi:hypothetical protein GH714_034688 [Hevea brasiliensis]|uniref:Glycosyltransferase n=1 Tax=Hevea brasiliensis TaxID=3981 RepID=A0A6A6M6N1_HEVBR|nr:hypothetical protein GH714_034688 [Hevea brasiliensis]